MWCTLKASPFLVYTIARLVSCVMSGSKKKTYLNKKNLGDDCVLKEERYSIIGLNLN
jgi:hypothetical protein